MSIAAVEYYPSIVYVVVVVKETLPGGRTEEELTYTNLFKLNKEF